MLDDAAEAGLSVVRCWAFADGPQWNALQVNMLFGLAGGLRFVQDGNCLHRRLSALASSSPSHCAPP